MDRPHSCRVACARRSVMVCLLILLAARPPGTAWANPPTEAEGLTDSRPEPPAKPAYPLPSRRFGLDADDPVPLIVAPAVDMTRIAIEDAAWRASNDRRLRFGVRRDLWLAPSMGRWDVVVGGRVWRADVASPSAAGIRLHFMSVNMPKGAELSIHARSIPDMVFGPFDGTGPLGRAEFWAPSCFGGDVVRIEYFEPDGAPALGAPLPFVIDAIQHLYRDPTIIAVESGLMSRIGNCHTDVACQETWANVALAVGGLSTIGSTGALFCTGQLLATSNADQTPYFLTANHCVNSAAQAAATEIVWRYQTSACNAAPPAIATLVRSGPCTMVATGTASSSSDFVLLMVEGALPAGLAWVGWVSTAAPTGTPSACVQHPSGSWKRIAFGNKVAGQVCSGSNFTQMDWTIGVTEPGSSGSGLFWNDPASSRHQKLYGQLYCGFSACTGTAANTLNDDFGRFDVTHNAISSFLAAGSDDGYEPNNSCTSARAISSGTFNNLIVKAASDDWYSFPLAPGQTLSVTLAFTHLNGDIDAELFTSCAASPVASSTRTTNTESLAYFNPTGVTQTIYLRVYLYSDVRNAYTLTLGAASTGPPNNVCANATSITEGATVFSTLGATTDGPAEPASCNFDLNPAIAADTWFRYTPSCSGTVIIDSCLASFDTELAIYGSSCPASAGNVLACNDDSDICGTGSTRSSVVFNATAGQPYLIRLGGFNAATGTGTLTVRCSPTTIVACCVQSSCLTLSTTDCASAGGQSLGVGLACGTSGNPTTCCRGNFNQSGGISVQDIFDFLSAYFANHPTADFNLSGGITVQDIFDFLVAYFSGCT